MNEHSVWTQVFQFVSETCELCLWLQLLRVVRDRKISTNHIHRKLGHQSFRVFAYIYFRVQLHYQNYSNLCSEFFLLFEWVNHFGWFQSVQPCSCVYMYMLLGHTSFSCVSMFFLAYHLWYNSYVYEFDYRDKYLCARILLLLFLCVNVQSNFLSAKSLLALVRLWQKHSSINA